MRTFGEGTYDNDTAMDLAGTLGNQFHEILIKGDPDEVRVIADLIAGSGLKHELDGTALEKLEAKSVIPPIYWPDMKDTAMQALKDIPNSWYREWSEPAEVRREVGELMARLEE
tara:strand:- start:299 stop:640 length:342 start_codon:yes stop_codon:yes gene_type:complete